MTTPDIPMIVLSSLLGLLSAAFIARMCWNVTHGGRASGLRTVCEVCGAPHPGVLQVPLLGYLVSRGRCRECGARLPLRFVLCEVWFSALFPLLLMAYGTQREVVELALLSCLLLVAALVDLDERVIPNMLVIIMVFVRVVFCLLSAYPLQQLLRSISAGLMLFLPLLLLVLVLERRGRGGGMGGGDLKLFLAVGMFFPWQRDVLLLVLACLFGVVSAFVGSRGRVQAGHTIAFAPAIACAAWVTMLIGGRILIWYLGLFT